MDQSEVKPLQHLAIIMDGNGRWAKKRGLPRTAGHKQGMSVVRDIAKAARELNISYLTLFGFSSENWGRPEEEVSTLMGLLRLYLEKETRTLVKENVRLRVIGDKAQFSQNLQDLLTKAEEATRDCTAQTLVLALSYGGRQDMVEATKAIARKVATGDVDPEAIDAGMIDSHLSSAGMPEPDLMIRTSGEQRLSNFLLWQTAYSEFAFTDTLWPDFTGEELASLVADFQKRDRRFGKVKEA